MVMTYFLLGCILGLIIGVLLGAFIAVKFDVVNTEYTIDKLRAKKGATINVKQEIETDIKPEKKKLLNRLFKFKKK